MMKRLLSLFLAMLLLSVILVIPGYAADVVEAECNSCYYPISVDEYVGGDFDEPRFLWTMTRRRFPQKILPVTDGCIICWI